VPSSYKMWTRFGYRTKLLSMFYELDDIHWNFVDPDSGRETRRQLEKRVLGCKSGWATIAYLYTEKPRHDSVWSPPKVAVAKYRRLKGVFRKKSHVVLSAAIAALLQDVLEEWLVFEPEIPEEEPVMPAEPAEDVDPPQVAVTA
jgi:hypothetical protein